MGKKKKKRGTTGWCFHTQINLMIFKEPSSLGLVLLLVKPENQSSFGAF